MGTGMTTVPEVERDVPGAGAAVGDPLMGAAPEGVPEIGACVPPGTLAVILTGIGIAGTVPEAVTGGSLNGVAVPERPGMEIGGPGRVCVGGTAGALAEDGGTDRLTGAGITEAVPAGGEAG